MYSNRKMGSSESLLDTTPTAEQKPSLPSDAHGSAHSSTTTPSQLSVSGRREERKAGGMFAEWHPVLLQKKAECVNSHSFQRTEVGPLLEELEKSETCVLVNGFTLKIHNFAQVHKFVT